MLFDRSARACSPRPTRTSAVLLAGCLFALLLGGANRAYARVKVNPIGPAKCANIYYDRSPRGGYTFGRTHALFLQNLLGHFPNVQQYVAPIETYQKGEIERCSATFYLGTHYETKVPDAFRQDFLNTSRNVFWAGYHIWGFDAPSLNQLWGVGYKGLTTIEPDKPDAYGQPGFFRQISYRGETFEKYGGWKEENGQRSFIAAFEMAHLEPLSQADEVNVISWARHSSRGTRAPYILRKANRWYMAESPFAFMTEDDRYLIFSDLIFDVLDEQPRYPDKKPAFFRVEDIHAELPLWPLFNTVETIAEFGIPFHIAGIPIFSDPYNVIFAEGRPFTPIGAREDFNAWADFAKQKGARWIMHGVTHQSGEFANPYSSSGDDFEFWDIVHNRPMPDDNAPDVLDRLTLGWDMMTRAKHKPLAWLTPHYQASPMNNRIFGEVFRWNIGRVIYFPFVTFGGERQRLTLNESFDQGGTSAAVRNKRKEQLGNLKSTLPPGVLPSGQFFPYEILGDVYGQRLIPENIGNLQPFMTPGVLNSRTADDMVRSIRRNRVLRDAWASFFFHPFLLKKLDDGGLSLKPNDTQVIRKLVRAALDNGYTFVALDDAFLAQNSNMRPQPQERK